MFGTFKGLRIKPVDVGEDSDYWVIKVPKPRRLLKMFAKLSRVVIEGLSSSISLDTPLILISAVSIGIVTFLVFTLVYRIPEVVAVLFSILLVVLYLLFLRRELRR
jgi:hypothetical protein